MTESIQNKRNFALSRWAVILGWVAMLIFACYASTHRNFPGDTWIALACGRHHANHGVDVTDPFSFLSLKPGPTQEDVGAWPAWAQRITSTIGIETVKYWHPTGWINQNWLTHRLFYWLVVKLGSHEQPNLDVLVYWKFSIYILTAICIYFTGRILGAHPLLSSGLACCVMVIGRPFFDIRPQGFTNLLASVFLLILVNTTYKNKLFIWLIVPLSIIWCNLHGGYILSLIHI